MSQASRNLAIRATAMPTHLNPFGGVFGEWIVSQLALGAGSEAIARERHGETESKVASGRFKFVAIGADDKPREI